MARQAQPGILMVDRTVHGPYENYQTPEQRIPATQLDHPWESCMTLGNNWGYIPGEEMKSPAKVIHTLIEVVAKGGSLLLGVGPKPDGTLSDTAVQRLEQIGTWMQKNGAAIYNTRTVKMYKDSTTYFTQNKTGNVRYALVCLPEEQPLPATVAWKNNNPKKGTKIILLQTGASVAWKQQGNKVTVQLPGTFVKSHAAMPALAFAFTPAE
jgi:alpha-L-fucosidase